jgi:hypothetical protein
MAELKRRARVAVRQQHHRGVRRAGLAKEGVDTIYFDRAMGNRDGRLRRAYDRTQGQRASPRNKGRSRPANGEDGRMAQTEQAWDWGIDLRDEERSELELLRRTVAELRTQLDQAYDSLKICRQRQQDATQALRQLDEAGLWRRGRVRRALRDSQLL